ncbi:family 4 carbohydrate esterase [Melampsora americana]|nr:family 4 carbohydrate esterase [Melampsora americana]
MFFDLRIPLLLALCTLVHLSKSNPLTSSKPDPLTTRELLHPRAVGQLYQTCNKPGLVALTFDDGPWIYENTISDFLKARNILGTFFINGDNYDCIYNQSIVNQLKHTFQQGHLIGSHTWSHPDITKLKDAELKVELDRMETALKRILGVVPRYFRAPYGNVDDRTLDILAKRGYKVINWTFDSGDAVGEPPEKSIKGYDELSKSFPSPQIALNHETYDTTANQVVPYAVDVLQKAGYKLVSMSECLGYKNTPEDFYQYVGEPQERDVSGFLI